MAFFRFSRDKRGYEHFYLVEPVTNRKGKSRPRVLYWYRTPPNVKVGRPPFDDEMRRAIEARYPDVTFDWTKIVEAPIPSADAEKWRERRRAERAERVARKSNAAVEGDEESEQPEEPDPAASIDAAASIDEEPLEPELPSPLGVDAEPGGDSLDSTNHVAATYRAPPADAAASAMPPTVPGDANAQETGDGGRGGRKRRRRRRGRGQSAPYASATPAAAGESPIDTSGSAVDDDTSDDDQTSDDPIDEPSGE